MFGRQKKQADGGEERVQVDTALESDVTRVEQSVAEYLRDPTDASRRSLLAALETLDEQTDQSDAYESSVIGSGAVGYASKGEVIGETSIDSVVDEMPSARAARADRACPGGQERGPWADDRDVRRPAVRACRSRRDTRSGTGRPMNMPAPFEQLLTLSENTTKTLAEVGFLLIVIAGVWFFFAELPIPNMKFAKLRRIVAEYLARHRRHPSDHRHSLGPVRIAPCRFLCAITMIVTCPSLSVSRASMEGR